MKALAFTICILVAGWILGWYEPFHLVVGSAVILGGGLLVVLWKKRMRLEDEQGIEDDGTARKLFIGALYGVVSLPLLAAGFWAASLTPVKTLFYNRDCQDHLIKIRILDEARAYERIVQIVDDRLQGNTSKDCARQLIESKIRALAGWSDQSGGIDQVMRLHQALEGARLIDNSDLVQLVEAKLKATERLKEIEGLLQKLKTTQISAEQTSRGLVVSLPDILFEPGKANLLADARAKLEQVASILNNEMTDKQVSVEGHTDSTGTAEANQRLSEARARGVGEMLIAAGVSRDRLTIQGFGQKRPVAPGDTVEDRAKNRRVEIVIHK